MREKQKETKKQVLSKETKATCQRTVKGEVVNKLGSLRKCICAKYRFQLDY